MTDEPLIYTTRGNLPVASLAYSTGWDDSAEATVFWEEYRLGEDLVKRSAHVLTKQGVAAFAESGGVN